MKLAFYKANQPLAQWDDRLIAWWTNGIYSHVELIDDYFMYSCSPRDGKVRRIHHIINEDLWDYVEVDVSHDTLVNFYLKTKGAKYDWFAILDFIIPFSDREDRCICSEWCSDVLKLSGDKRFQNLDTAKISPNRLYEIVTKER